MVILVIISHAFPTISAKTRTPAKYITVTNNIVCGVAGLGKFPIIVIVILDK
jgi:hypothetical protein